MEHPTLVEDMDERSLDTTVSRLSLNNTEADLKDPLLEKEQRNKEEVVELSRPPGAFSILIFNMGISGSFFGVFAVLFELLVGFGLTPNMGVFIVNTLLSLNYISALLGAQLADKLFGKFKTLMLFASILMVGLGLLAVGSVPVIQAGDFLRIVGLLCLVVGYGAANPCVSAFLGDQFSPMQSHQSGKFFAFFYASVQAGAVISEIIIPVLRPVIGGYAFSILAAANFVTLVIFLLKRKVYVATPPSRSHKQPSVWPIVFRVIGIHAFCSSAEKESKLQRLEDEHGHALTSSARTIAHILKIFVPAVPMYFAVYFQMFSMWQATALQLNNEVFTGYKLDVAMLTTLDPVFVLIWTPIFSYSVYPMYKRWKGREFPALHRMFTGLCCTVASFLWTALVQVMAGSATKPSVLIMVPQYVLIASSEILFISTGIEYAYTYAPKSLKAVITAVFWLCVALGNEIIAITAISQPTLTPQAMTIQYFIFTGVMAAVAAVFFFWCVWKSDERKATEDGEDS